MYMFMLSLVFVIVWGLFESRIFCPTHLFVYIPVLYCNRIGGVIVNVLASSAVDHVFESLSGLTKNYKIVISCFSARQAALRRTLVYITVCFSAKQAALRRKTGLYICLFLR